MRKYGKPQEDKERVRRNYVISAPRGTDEIQEENYVRRKGTAFYGIPHRTRFLFSTP